MSPTLLLLLITVAPIAVTLVLRSNAAVTFLALCAGTVLLQFVGSDASLVLLGLLPHASLVLQKVLYISLLLLPPLVAAVLLRKKAKGLRLFLHVLPAVALGGLTAVSVVPLLSPLMSQQIMRTGLWHNIYQLQGIIVGVGVIVSLALLKPAKPKDDKKKHHK